MSFATVDDLKLRWANHPDDDKVIEARLEDATVFIKALYGKRIPLDMSDDLSILLKSLTVQIARRSLAAEQEGREVSSTTRTAGSFSETVSYRNTEGNLFLTGAEIEALEALLDINAPKVKGMMSLEAIGW